MPSSTGDRPLASGTAISALRHRTFRIVFFGAFASNIGTWMQNVVLGAYAYNITHSSTFVGVIIFAQLGPALLLAMVGGLIADKVDRKKFLIVLSVRAADLLARPGVGGADSVAFARRARPDGGDGRASEARCSAPPIRPSSPAWCDAPICPVRSR